MVLDLSVKGHIAVTMENYLKGVISDYEELEILTGTVASPDMEHLYATRKENNQKKLDEKQAAEFHHDVTQLIFVGPWAQKDIQTQSLFPNHKSADPKNGCLGEIKARLTLCVPTNNPTTKPEGRQSNSYKMVG